MNTAASPATATTDHYLLVVTALLATFMQAINISIPNAAVLHIQGTLSMTDDEIGWVFSSYIVGGAIVMPLTPWLAAKFGRTRVLLCALAIFLVALLTNTRVEGSLELVASRILQGAASGVLPGLAMSILLEQFSAAAHGRVGATWTVTSLFGMLSGPSLGGWLCEEYGWRSIFYFSLPLIAFIFIVIAFWLPEKKAEKAPAFDLYGMAAFSLGIAGLQMMLDRGQRMEWFASTEIWLEASASVLGFFFYAAHISSRSTHFFNKALFKDRNFTLSTIMFFGLGFVLLPTLALTSPMLDELLGYPGDAAGYATIPRGIALLSALILTWNIPARLDNRLFIVTGMSLAVYGTWRMLGYSPLMDAWPVLIAGFIQGAGLGILMPALTRAAFSTLDPKLRPEGTLLFNLARTYGSTVGIAVVQIFIYRNTQSVHLSLASHITSYGAGHHAGPSLAMLNEMITGQAAMIALIGQFKLLMIAMLLVSPLVLFLRRPQTAA